MATTNITDIGRSQTISEIKPSSTIENISKGSAIVSNIGLLVTAATIAISPVVQNLSPGSIESLQIVDYPKTISVTHTLPFMLSITNIGIEGYTPSNAPGIGVQVIGFSNYIL